MTPIAVSVDIDGPQEEVFAYVTDPSRFIEWQAGVVGGCMEDRASPAVGSKCLITRRIGGAEREVTSEITKLDPRGAMGSAGHRRSNPRIGKLLVPLIVRRQAHDEMPANVQRLKERVEARASPPLA